MVHCPRCDKFILDDPNRLEVYTCPNCGKMFTKEASDND